jgi:GNAT superfamily N-acetyltransferase
MNAGETPEAAMKRELREELGVRSSLDYMAAFYGTASWKGKTFPIISHAFLVEVEGDVNLVDTKENSAFTWLPLGTIDPEQIAFDSNQDIVRFVKEKFLIDLEQLTKLISQLDSATRVKEINFYRSVLNGYVSKKYVDGKLVGLGWIFPRRTLSRKQAVVEDMIVDNSQRGKGYGKEILFDLMRWAKEDGVEVIELTSGSHRVPANELYKKVGFQLHPTNHYLYKVV